MISHNKPDQRVEPNRRHVLPFDVGLGFAVAACAPSFPSAVAHPDRYCALGPPIALT
jgi:hypothetical protein